MLSQEEALTAMEQLQRVQNTAARLTVLLTDPRVIVNNSCATSVTFIWAIHQI
jgi:hypothetical protein